MSKDLMKQLRKLKKKEAAILKKKEDQRLKDPFEPYRNKIKEKIPDKLEMALERAFHLIFEKGLPYIARTYLKG